MPIASTKGSRRILAVTASVALSLSAFLLFGCSRGSSGNPIGAQRVLAETADAFSNPEAAGLHSYSGVATITSTGRNDGGTPDGEPIESTLSFAFLAPDHYRAEIASESPAISAGGRFLMLTDGNSAWSYNSESLTYRRLPAGGLQYLQYETNPGLSACCSVANLLQRLNRGDSSISAAIIREDKLLNRDVYVVEVSPVYTSAESGMGGTPQESAGGTLRLWVDKEFFFTLRLEAPAGPDASDGTVRVDYANIDFNNDVSPDTFLHLEQQKLSKPPTLTLRRQ